MIRTSLARTMPARRWNTLKVTSTRCRNRSRNSSPDRLATRHSSVATMLAERGQLAEIVAGGEGGKGDLAAGERVVERAGAPMHQEEHLAAVGAALEDAL